MKDKPNSTVARVVSGINRRLAKIGIHLHPFFLTREDLQPDLRPALVLNPSFAMSELKEADLPGINALRPDMKLERYRQFLQEGKRCFGIWDNKVLIAKMWLNLDDFNAEIYSRPLEPDEAYLFDAFSNPDYRGQNLAPILRLRCYEEAKQLGRNRIYSITDFPNIAARKFKIKLNAQHQELKLWVRMGGRGSKTITLRRFTLDV